MISKLEKDKTNNDKALMEIHIRALFPVNSENFIYPFEKFKHPLPFMILGRTKKGNIFKLRLDLPVELSKVLTEYLSNEDVLETPESKPRFYKRYLAEIEKYYKIKNVWLGAAFKFPGIRINQRNCEVLTGENFSLLKKSFPGLDTFENIKPVVSKNEDGKYVSVCFSSRLTAFAAEAGVETLRNYRRRGYAAESVIMWESIIRGKNIIPLYSCSWDNKSSIALAAKLKLKLYGSTFHIS